MIALADHFALTDTGSDEPGEWIYLTAADVLQGQLNAGWPNRLRRLRYDPERGQEIELEVSGTGPILRIRLPFTFRDLPYDGRKLIQAWEPRWDEHGNMIGAGGWESRWFERFFKETHLVVEVVEKPWVL